MWSREEYRGQIVIRQGHREVHGASDVWCSTESCLFVFENMRFILRFSLPEIDIVRSSQIAATARGADIEQLYGKLAWLTFLGQRPAASRVWASLTGAVSCKAELQGRDCKKEAARVQQDRNEAQGHLLS
jgi:hypothetical protein